MGINLNSLALDTATVVVEFQGQEATITYRPGILTTNRLTQLRNEAHNDDMDSITSFLSDVMSDWDVTRGKTKVPIDSDGLGAIPMVFLKTIMQAIMEDSSAGEN